MTVRQPALANQLIHGDFRNYSSQRRFGYIIAIQAFQHGFEADVAKYFSNVACLLSPGGLFFLRVNAASTQITKPHSIVEKNALGGVTILYETGPKKGLPVHFYGREELLNLTGEHFDMVDELREDVTIRTPPEVGCWAQWEGIWRRRGS